MQPSVAPGWTEIGPSPLISTNDPGLQQDYGFATGQVTAVAVDQNDPTGNTVYIGGSVRRRVEIDLSSES